ncbi:MAG: ion transporter [Oscillospiraceae bacterium]|nr:ion transporter [Oscillospiraceae bacterium]
MTALKKRVYKIIQPRKSQDLVSTVFDWLIVSLIAINVFVIVLDTFELPKTLSLILRIIDVTTVVIFTIEYTLRLWTADIIYKNKTPFKARLTYAFTFLMLIDLIAILPSYLRLVLYIDLDVLRIFRLLRIFWFFRIKREYIKSLSTIFDVFKKKALSLFFSIFIIFTLMVIASVLMYNAEKDAQPEVFKNALSGLWWSVITITTVGYGEIYPITAMGKVLGAFFSILSIGLIAIPTGIISAGFIERAREERMNAKGNKRFCPYCGKDVEE